MAYNYNKILYSLQLQYSYAVAAILLFINWFIDFSLSENICDALPPVSSLLEITTSSVIASGVGICKVLLQS